MKALRSLLIFFVLSLLLVPDYASAKVETEQIIQDYDFSSSNNYAYWGVCRGNYPTTNSAGKKVGPVFNIALDNVNKWAEIYNTASAGSTTQEWGYDEWAYIYQEVSIPKVNIVNATLSILSNSHWPYMTVKLEYGIASKPDRNDWIDYISSVAWDDQLRYYNLNLTSALQGKEGKSVYVMVGIYMPRTSTLQNGHTIIYTVKLNIQYEGNSSGSSGGSGGWNNGGSWSGGGGSWSGGGAWWSGGSTWWGGGGWFSHTKNANQTYVEMMANRVMNILSIVSMGIIAVLWVKVGTDYFSDNPDKKLRLKDDLFLAGVGTLIIAMVVLGVWWMLAGWVVGASQIILGVVI